MKVDERRRARIAEGKVDIIQHEWKVNEEWVEVYIIKWKDPVLEVKKLLGNPALNTWGTINVLGDFYNWLHEEKIEKPMKFVDIYTNPEFKTFVVTEYLKFKKVL